MLFFRCIQFFPTRALRRLRDGAHRCAAAPLAALLLTASAHALTDTDDAVDAVAVAVAVIAAAEPMQARGDLKSQFAVYPDVLALLLQGDLKTALLALQRYQQDDRAFGNNAQYQHLLGILALKNGEHALAAAAFERSLLIDPNNAGAWLDLAIASAKLGDDDSALNYFDYVESKFAPPDAIRMLIGSFRSGILSRKKSHGWHFSLQSMAGYDTNANSGLRDGVIFLTVADQRLGLLLDSEFNARGDSFVQLGGSAHSVTTLNRAYRLEFAASARQRSYLHEHDFSILDINASLGLHRRVGDGDASVWMHGSKVMLGSARLLNSTRWVLQFEQPMGDCMAGVSTELEARRYAKSGSLDGDLVWGQGGLACKWRLAGKELQTTLVARIGDDRARSERAGGNTLRSELLLQLALPADNGSRTELTWHMARARDRDGYSALLEHNAVRELTRHLLRLAWIMPMAHDTELVLAAENNRVLSNLPLFRQTGSTVSLEVRKQF